MKRILSYLFLLCNFRYSRAQNYYEPSLYNGPDNCCKHTANWDDPFTLMCQTCAYDNLGLLNIGKTYKYYKNNNVAYKVGCSSTGTNTVYCKGTNNENGGKPTYTARCDDSCLSNYHNIPEVENLWIYDTTHQGKRPNCPKAIMPGAKNKNYRYSTINTCKKLCINEPTGKCNILSRYGVGIKRDNDPWHCWFYACPDPFSFDWVVQDSWGHYASSCNTYILPIRHYNYDDFNCSITDISDSTDKIRYLNKTRYINKTRYLNKTRIINETIYINKTNYITQINYKNITNYIDRYRIFNKTIYHYKNKTITIYNNQTLYNIINKDIYNIINITNIFNKTRIVNVTNVVQLTIWREKIKWINKTHVFNKTIYNTIHVLVQHNTTLNSNNISFSNSIDCDDNYIPSSYDNQQHIVNHNTTESSIDLENTTINFIFMVGFFTLLACAVCGSFYLFWQCWCKENCQEIDELCCQTKKAR